MSVGHSTTLMQQLCKEKRAAGALLCISPQLQSTLKLQFMCSPDHRCCDNPQGNCKGWRERGVGSKSRLIGDVCTVCLLSPSELMLFEWMRQKLILSPFR